MKKTLLFIIIFLFSSHSFGEEALEEIFFEKEVVEAVTKKAEKVEEVPAPITILKREEFMRYGFLDLNRALSFQPGIEVVESFFGYSEIVIRGVYPTHYNNKSLLLVDQYPIYEPVNGSFHLEEVPLGMIERVEIIRGPGSSIYGTNAYSGVINVVPRKDVNGFEFDILSGGRSGSAVTRGLVTYGEKIMNADFLLSSEIFWDHGYQFAGSDELDQLDSVNYENRYGNLGFLINAERFRLIGGYFNQKKMKFGIVPVWATNGPSYYEGFWVETLGKLIQSERFVLTGRLGFNNLQRVSELRGLKGTTYPSGETGVFPVEMYSGGDNSRMELSGDLKISDSTSILSGVVLAREHTDPYLFANPETKEFHSLTAFTESEWKMNYGFYLEGSYHHRIFNLYLGGRLDNDTKRQSMRLTPRGGIIVKPLTNLSTKLIYSEAFRYPNFFEYDLFTSNVLIGNPDLKEEFIRNADFIVEGEAFRTKGRLDLFFMTTDNLIDRGISTRVDQYPKEMQYFNFSGYSIYGAEAEIKTKPVKALELFINCTLRDGKLKEPKPDDIKATHEIPYVSKFFMNAGLVLSLPYNLEISPTYSLIGKKKKYIEVSGEPDNSTPSYSLLNLTGSLNYRNLTLRAIALNILGTAIKYPDHIRRKVYIPGDAQRSFYLEVNYKL